MYDGREMGCTGLDFASVLPETQFTMLTPTSLSMLGIAWVAVHALALSRQGDFFFWGPDNEINHLTNTWFSQNAI